MATAPILTGTVTVLSMGSPVTGFTNLPVETMTLTEDRSASQRGRLSVTLSPAGLVPEDLDSPIAPNGNELMATAGWQYPSGRLELVQLGIFPISTVTIAHSPTDTTLTVDTYDRSWTVSRRALRTPYSIGAPVWVASTAYGVGAIVQPATANTFMYTCIGGGTSGTSEPTWPTTAGSVTDGTVTWEFGGTLALPTLDAAIKSLIALHTTTMPPFTFSITPTTVQAPDVAWNEGQDPWQAACNDLAPAAGYELYFDRNGNMIGKPIPDPTTSPVSWNYCEAGGGILIESISRVLTAESVSNDFTSSSSLVCEQVADTDPSSPTNIGSKFGDIPTFISDDLLTTAAAATAESQLNLTASLGQIDTLSLTCIPNTAIQIDDIVSVTAGGLRLSNALYVVDANSVVVSAQGRSVLTLRRVTS